MSTTITIHPASSIIIAAAGAMETDREILRQKRELAAEEGRDLLVRYYDRRIADLDRSIRGADALIAAGEEMRLRTFPGAPGRELDVLGDTT